MSRSYRKPYWSAEGKGLRKAKRRASKAVRLSPFGSTPVKGNHYRRLFCSWNIRDFRTYWDEPKGRRK